jgi:hypothetical protein
MGADFPLLSNEILLPNLVFFRSLLGSEAIIIHAEGVAAGQNDCLHHDPSHRCDLPAGRPLSASDRNQSKPCIGLLRLEHVVGHSWRANPGYLSRVPKNR